MEQAQVSLARTGDATLLLRLSGSWQLRHELPSPTLVQREIETAHPRCVAFDAAALTAWDSGLLTFLIKVSELCQQHDITTDPDGLPSGVRRLLALAAAVPERKGARHATVVPSWLARVGTAFLGAREPVRQMLAFIGQITVVFGKLLRRKARFRTSDLMLLIQQAGADALGIITLISFLVGTILAFVGAVQLQQFGAAIYVADLVGIAMVREMGAMMTAIVIAGRTGAAYAAQLGSMKVTQETDALSTMGISPLEFLVLPRMI